MKKTLTLGALLALLLLLLVPAQAEIQGFAKGQGYQYVYFGEYPYERDGTVQPVLWRVLSVRDSKALLLTEYIIDTDQIIFVTDQKIIENHSYRRIETFEESDLFPKLSTEYVDRLLGDLDQRIQDDPNVLKGYLDVLRNAGDLRELADQEYHAREPFADPVVTQLRDAGLDVRHGTRQELALGGKCRQQGVDRGGVLDPGGADLRAGAWRLRRHVRLLPPRNT